MSTAKKIREAAIAEATEAALFRGQEDAYGNPKVPTAEYFAAVEKLLELYEPPLLPRARLEMRELADAYARIRQLSGFDEDFLRQQYHPTWLRLWRSRDAAQAALHRDPPRSLPMPEPPAQLRSQGVSREQIAHAWNWLTEDPDRGKVPDVERVQREMDKPGAELTPEAIETRRQYALEQLGFVLPAGETTAAV